MALSIETQAILDRLKAEGALIRNGANSIRTVNLKLDKFNDVFSSISTNISEQTKMMQIQSGIASENLEKSRTQEQLDEVQTKEKEKDTSSSDKTNEAIEKIGDSISSALSFRSVLSGMKNLAIGAAAAFVGYNFLKGFIDEKYDGAWTKMETGLVSLGKSIGNIDTEKLSKNISDFVDSLPDLTSMIKSITTTFSDFKKMWNEYSWGDIILGIFQAMSYTTLAILGLRTFGPAIRALLGRKMAEAGATAAEIAAARAAARAGAGVGAAALGEAIGIDKSGRAIYRNSAGAITDDAGRVLAATDVPDHLRPQSPPARNFGTNAAGDLISTNTGKPLTGAARTTAEAAAASDRMLIERAQRFAANQTAARAAQVGAAAVPTGHGKRLASRLAGKIATEAGKRAWKVAATAVPLVGMVAGFGFALWNLFKGDYTSAAINGTSLLLPSVSGTALDITSIGTEIFFMLYEDENGNKGITYNAANQEHNDFMLAIGDELAKAVKDYLESESDQKSAERRINYENSSSEDQARMNAEAERLAWSYQGPGGQTHFRQASKETEEYLNSILNDPNNQGNYTFDPSGRRMYYTPRGGMMQELGPTSQFSVVPSSTTAKGLELLSSSGGPAGAPIVINAPVSTSAPTILNQAGSTVSQISYTGGSGFAMGPSLLPYGITSNIA